MVVLQGQFSVVLWTENSDWNWKKNCSKTTIVKLFMDHSEVSVLPAGCSRLISSAMECQSHTIFHWWPHSLNFTFFIGDSTAHKTVLFASISRNSPTKLSALRNSFCSLLKCPQTLHFWTSFTVQFDIIKQKLSMSFVSFQSEWECWLHEGWF